MYALIQNKREIDFFVGPLKMFQLLQIEAHSIEQMKIRFKITRELRFVNNIWFWTSIFRFYMKSTPSVRQLNCATDKMKILFQFYCLRIVKLFHGILEFHNTVWSMIYSIHEKQIEPFWLSTVDLGLFWLLEVTSHRFSIDRYQWLAMKADSPIFAINRSIH